jgi:hypothetical protein
MCALTLIGVFWKMKPGFGPNNLQAVGIVLIAFLASVLSILRPDGLNAAMGILGAVGGYLFGMRSNPPDVKPVCPAATTTDSPPGNGTKLNSNQVAPGRWQPRRAFDYHRQLANGDAIFARVLSARRKCMLSPSKSLGNSITNQWRTRDGVFR